VSRGGERGLGACAGGAGISDTDLVRSWVPGGAKAPGRGGDPVRPEPKEKEGREPDATVLSARDLSCSDQLKPWSLAVPGLPPPGRRIAAAAPKLMRRLKGVAGTVRAEVGESSSSMAFSSKSELVDVLARRARLEAAGGKAPAIPRVVVVVRDSLRRCSLMAAVVTALGKTGVPEIELLR
jgi:hypothetical protein